MLKGIRLARFKRFNELEVELRPFTVLMGENSSGKTTVLQAINLALNTIASYSFITPARGGKVKIRSKGVGLTNLAGINLSDFRELYYGKISRKGQGAGGAGIDLIDEKENTYRLQITSLFGSFNIKCISSQDDLDHQPTLHKKQPLFISGFVGLRAAEERAFPVAIRDRLRAGQVSNVIRNLLLDTKEEAPARYQSLKERLEKDFDFHLDEIVFEKTNDLHVKAEYSDVCDKNSVSLDFNASGSGFMQILQILTPIYRFCPAESEIVLLDEPDAHLHPNLQSALANTLRKIQSELNIQIIVSTHSTSIIRSADPSEVVPVSSKSKINKPLTKSTEVEQQITVNLDSYSLAKSVISGKLVFLEDANNSILEACDRALGVKCFTGPNTVPLLLGRGKDDKVPFQIGPILKTLLDKEIEIHFLRDGDGLNTEWRSKVSKYAENCKIKVHQLERHEIENYLLSANLIHRAVSKKHGQCKFTKEFIEEKLTAMLKETIQLSKYCYDDALYDAIHKTAIAINEQNFKNPTACRTEARSMREDYEKLNTFEKLVVVGMGKEALSRLFAWLNHEEKLSLSKQDLLDALEQGDLPQEIGSILSALRSDAAKPKPESLEKVPVEMMEILDEEQPLGPLFSNLKPLDPS